ncbi:hypothetical protein [Sphingorhabdus lacus]|nr:hypothetical protein [Sphingorhabdus lacus]
MTIFGVKKTVMLNLFQHLTFGRLSKTLEQVQGDGLLAKGDGLSAQGDGF